MGTKTVRRGRSIVRAVKLLAALVALSALSGCVMFALAPLPDTVEEEVMDATARRFDAAIVYVEIAGESTVYAAGTTSRTSGAPVESDTLFKIASISKLYVAAATVMLVADDQLSLDDTVAQLLPDMAGQVANSGSITLRMLLQHRSGIPDFIDQDGFSWVDAPGDNAAAVALVSGASAEFDPDRRYKYSNTNYVLLGEIMDRELGYYHQDFVDERILTPLGLSDTYAELSDVALDDVMSGYDVTSDDADWKEADYRLPGGSMIATADDTGRFLRALIDGSLFTDEEQTIYTSVYEYEHTGLLPGYQSIARYDDGLDAVVVQFTNVSGGNQWMRSEAVYSRIIRILRRNN